MGFQKNNKSKRKDASKGRKTENSQTKNYKKTIAKNENNLSTLFKSDELQEIRKILKIKDLVKNNNYA